MFAFILKRCGWVKNLNVTCNYSSENELDNLEISATKKSH